MVETVTVAALSANTPAANALLVQSAMAAARTQEKVIKLPGRQAGAVVRYGAFACTANITDFPVTLKAEDPNNPPQCIAFAITGTTRTGPLNTTTGTRASNVRNLTIDGLHWYAPRVTRVKRPDDSFYNFRDDDVGLGYGWHMTPEIDGFNGNYDKNGGFIMCLQGIQGTTGLVIQNNYFTGYNRIIDIPSTSGVTIRHNTFQNWHEDCIFIGGGNNIVIEYNLWLQANCLSAQDSYYGFGYLAGGGGPQPISSDVPNGAPPHSDMVQLYGKTTNLLMQFNEQYDDTERAHTLLAKISDGGPGGKQPVQLSEYHTGLVVRNNFSISSHPNGLWFTYTTGALVERNKGLRSTGADTQVSLQVISGIGSSGVKYNIDATVRNNRAQKLNINGAETVSNNVQTNDPDDLPPGWVEFRNPVTWPGKTPAGAKYAGQYGGGGSVVPTVPAGLTTGQVSFKALVVGPTLPVGDGRRTFTEAIPKLIIRFNTGTAAVTAGQTITNGAGTPATAIALADAVIQSGSYGGGDAAGYIHIGTIAGTWGAGDNIKVSSTQKSKVATVPNTSPASDAYELQWSSDADATLRPMVQIADDGTDQIWRATSSDGGHLRNPNESFTNVKTYYRVSNGSTLSDPSTYTFTETVPYVGEPDPVATRILNFDTLQRPLTTSGVRYARILTASGRNWRKLL